MPVDREKIARLERELEEAKRQLLQEDGERYRILMRELSEEEKWKASWKSGTGAGHSVARSVA
jgi:hypothetical protein